MRGKHQNVTVRRNTGRYLEWEVKKEGFTRGTITRTAEGRWLLRDYTGREIAISSDWHAIRRFAREYFA